VGLSDHLRHIPVISKVPRMNGTKSQDKEAIGVRKVDDEIGAFLKRFLNSRPR
jgi:hypothetical protein